MSSGTRIIEVRQNVLKQNDVVARALRQRFHDASVFVVSLVSSPGSGKTMLLEKTLGLLQPVKGLVVALQWHAGMHGFAEARQARA